MTAPSDPVASDSLASVPEPRDPATGDSGVPSAPVNVGGIAIPGLRLRVTPQHVRDYGIIVFAAALFIYFTVASSTFLTSANLLNIVYQNATIGIAACAVTFTIIAGNFDLSLGSIFALSEVLGAWAAVHWGVAWCFPVAIGSGAVMGLINGLLVTKLRVNAFLATLASGLTFGGIAVGVTHGGLLITPTSSAFTFIGQHKAGGIWDSAIIFIVLAIVLQLVLAYTVFGRHLYGVGDNRNAARLSGLKVDRTVILTFVITGAACGLAGLIDSSMTGSGTSSQADSPGNSRCSRSPASPSAAPASSAESASVWRTVLGVLMLGMITNGFDLLAVADYWQNIIRGILIILAVALSFVVDRRNA